MNCELLLALTGVKKSEDGKRNMSNARTGTKRVYNRYNKFSYIKVEDLHKYFLRDGKYYDYSA